MANDAARRQAVVMRNTAETRIGLELDLAGGPSLISTGIGFFDHMLEQIARHADVMMQLSVSGDLRVDMHHTVEDTGIVLGEAFAQALGDKTGIRRFGMALAPLDEALARVVLDLSGRPGLFYRAKFSRPLVGELEVQLVREFFQGVANSAKCTLHIDLLEGDNAHHQVEAIFKAFALALCEAITIEPTRVGVPSTKGTL